MNIQDLFYLVGIIFMVAGSILIITITIIAILLYRKMSEVRNFVMNNVANVLRNILNPKEAAISIGKHAARTAIRRIREVF